MSYRSLFVCWVLTSILGAGTIVRAQTSPTWTRTLQLGGPRTDQVLATAVDAQGNVYQAGYFMGAIACGSLTLTVASSATYDAYVVKRDAQGSVLWARQVGSQSNKSTSPTHPVYGTARGSQLTLDAAGNVYLTGFFRGEITFGGAAISLTAPAGAPAAFVAKYSPQGILSWASKAQATQEVDASGLAVAPTGDVFVAGYFKGNLTLGASVLTSTAGTNDAFLVKYSPAGVPQWVRQAGGPADDYGFSVQAGPAGDVYLAGSFTSTLSAGGKTATGYGNTDIFLARYDGTGTAQWLQAFGGPGEDYAGPLALAPTGEVYMAGAFSLTAQFGGQSVTSVGGTDGFLAKCTAQGAPLWVQQMGGSGNDSADNLLLPPGGPVYVSGSFEGSSTFATQILTSVGGTDVFVARYDPAGSLVWATRGGGTQAEGCGGLSCRASGELELGVQFYGVAQFGFLTATSLGNADVLLSRLQDPTPW